MDIYDGLLTTYMGGFVSFVQKWFLMFLIGAVFGKIMDVTGAADSLARVVLRVVGENGFLWESVLYLHCLLHPEFPYTLHYSSYCACDQDVQTGKSFPVLYYRRIFSGN